MLIGAALLWGIRSRPNIIISLQLDGNFVEAHCRQVGTHHCVDHTRVFIHTIIILYCIHILMSSKRFGTRTTPLGYTYIVHLYMLRYYMRHILIGQPFIILSYPMPQRRHFYNRKHMWSYLVTLE